MSQDEKLDELYQEYLKKNKEKGILNLDEMTPDEIFRELNYNEFCFHVVLVAAYTDWMCYTTYVFKNLENNGNILTEYFMCVRFPNWNTRIIGVGEEGYVNLRFVIAGEDKWFSNGSFIPYNYTGVHFLNFIPFGADNSDKDEKAKVDLDSIKNVVKAPEGFEDELEDDDALIRMQEEMFYVESKI